MELKLTADYYWEDEVDKNISLKVIHDEGEPCIDLCWESGGKEGFISIDNIDAIMLAEYIMKLKEYGYFQI